ncbi:aminotransferase class I/II-fold pyridoxal phosphate-dependent enzyme [Paenibacillus septentrionalis]|uniref:Aminotransferase class I/II-fold pyridoxal phosphate-dependent enzyme n=1 Tax=Paenibacillus septentrionalis TaxID=429342 RepID=A0ABW1V9J7_9BACL
MTNKKWKAPLLEHLTAFAKLAPASFHVPGHRNGTVYLRLLTEHSQLSHHFEAISQIAQLDVTELSHTDDLHDPQGVIAEAQKLAAALYESEHCFFLVGGSTAGNLALVLSLCEEQDTIIMQRNVHKSLINACKLAGANVVFLQPELEPSTQLSVIPSLDTVEEALRRFPHAKAVFLTNPNYYGLSSDLTAYAELVHRFNIPLIIDEAHGAHYGIAPYSPRSSITTGADAVVQSTHKTLPAFTMGAMLHIQGPYIKQESIQQQLAMLESSSPSYLIMSSLDMARAVLDCYGSKWFAQSYALRQQLIDWLGQHSRLDIALLPEESRYSQDPYRLLLYDTKQELSGYELQRRLEKYGVWAEMSTPIYVVLVWHMAMTEDELERLKTVLLELSQDTESEAESKVMPAAVPKQTLKRLIAADKAILEANAQLAISEPISFNRCQPQLTRIINLVEAEGMQCAEMIVPYPPGIPVLYERETITADHIREIRRYIEGGARFQGKAANDVLERIKVFAR